MHTPHNYGDGDDDDDDDDNDDVDDNDDDDEDDDDNFYYGNDGSSLLAVLSPWPWSVINDMLSLNWNFKHFRGTEKLKQKQLKKIDFAAFQA